MTSQAKVLEKRLLEAGSNLLKLGAIIGEFGIDHSNVEIDTPKQARRLIIKHIECIKGQQTHHTENLENRTSRLLDYLREERRHQISCKTLFEDAVYELHLQSNLIKCSLQLQNSDFEADMLKRKRSLEKGDLRILITGEICAGKSSVMNMLMGGCYMPVGHGPCTLIPCEVKQSKDRKAALHYADTRFSTREVTIDTNEKNQVWKQLRDCVETGKDMLQETEQRTNEQLKKIVLYWNFPFLTDKHQTHVKYAAVAKTESEESEKIINGITFVDAPGIHDTDQTFTSIHEFIEDSDGFLFIINTSQHAGIDRDRLVRLMNDARTIFQRKNDIFTPRCALFICNKWDLVENDKQMNLRKEILNKLQACWSRVTEKQVVPCNGSVQVLRSIQQADYSDEDISFYHQICSFIETATRTKTETHCWWLSNLVERTLAITVNMQSIFQNSDTNKERVLEQLQRDINAVEKAKETMDDLDKRLNDNLNRNLKKIQKCIQTMLKNDKPSLAVWHINDIPRQGRNENWQHLSYKINEAVGRKIEEHILKNTQVDLIKSQCSNKVDSGLNEAIKVYANLESQLTFKREIRNERLADLVGLISESASDLTWEEIAGVVVAVVFPLAPILILILNAIDSVKTTTMLNDEGHFQEDCYLYMKRQTEILVDNILSSQLQQVSEALLDGQLRNSKFVLKYFRSCLDIQHQLLSELMIELSSSKSEQKRIEQIQLLSDKTLQLLISDILCPGVDKHMVCFDHCEKNCLGNGSFGIVYKGKLLSGIQDTDVAVKVIKWPRGHGKCPDDTYIYRECFNLRMLSVQPEAFRKNVVEFYGEFVEVSSTDYLLHIVMEICDESLDRLIKKAMLFLPWCSYRGIDFPGKKQIYTHGISYVIHLARQAATGIQFLHHNNVVHRDIKPHNFLIKYVKNDAIVKICDFGLSREQTLIKSLRCVGTPVYNAPEVLAGEKNTFESDIYSFGLVIWELWYGKGVYEDLSKAEICHPRRNMPKLTDIQPPTPLKELMKLMWRKNKKDRPDASSVVSRLKELKKRYGRGQSDLTETAL